MKIKTPSDTLLKTIVEMFKSPVILGLEFVRSIILLILIAYCTLYVLILKHNENIRHLKIEAIIDNYIQICTTA